MRLPERARWLVIRVLNRFTEQCWADLVVWAEYGDGQRSPLHPVTGQCWTGEGDTGPCYCGKRGVPEWS